MLHIATECLQVYRSEKAKHLPLSEIQRMETGTEIYVRKIFYSSDATDQTLN
jgi:hypothetical protein